MFKSNENCFIIVNFSFILEDCTKHCFQLHAEAGQTAVVISYDSKQSKEPKNQRSKDKKTRTRRQRDGASSWYDKAVNTEYHKEVMPIPKGKAGLLIGKKGWRIKDIKEQSGVKELNIRDDQVHIRGTEEQCLNAKKIINMILKVLFKSPFFVLILYMFLSLT